MTEEENKEYNKKYIELQNKGFTRDQIINKIGEGGLWEGWSAYPDKMVTAQVIHKVLTEEKPKYTGYGYHGGGRPRKDAEARRKTISISGTPSEIEQLKQNAAAAGLNVSRYVLDNLAKN